MPSAMSSARFHLLGEDPLTAREIHFESSLDFEELQNLIASHFAICESKGVSFISHGTELNSTTEVSSVRPEDVVAVAIDGVGVREVPGPKGFPYIGNYLDTFPDHLGNDQRHFDAYGSLFKTTNFGSRIYHTNSAKLANIFFAESDFFSKLIVPGHPLHPIKLQEAGVFLGDTDTEYWKQAHKFLPPALSPKAVKHYAPSMQSTVEGAFKVFDELDERGEAWNVYQYMLKLGSEAVGKIVLGMDMDHFSSVDAPLHEMIIRIAQGLELNKRISAFGSWYAKMPLPDPMALRAVRARIEALLLDSISKASKGGEDLELQDAALGADNMVDYCLRATDSKGNKLPAAQFSEALVVATGAGFTTTSSLLSWLIYSLVAYDGMQARLLQELIDYGWDEDTKVNADEINSLPFLDKFVKETQRRHNPSYQPARTAKVDMILPGGYKLPKDSIVIPALHHIHNNAELWDNPARFDPDRWDTDKVKNRPAGSYQPFASGPRSCIGFNFALLEAKTFLVKLVYRYKFTLAEGAMGPVEYDPYFQLIRPNNLYVHAERRVKWPAKSE